MTASTRARPFPAAVVRPKVLNARMRPGLKGGGSTLSPSARKLMVVVTTEMAKHPGAVVVLGRAPDREVQDEVLQALSPEERDHVRFESSGDGMDGIKEDEARSDVPSSGDREDNRRRIEAFFRLVDAWKAEPGDEDDRIGAILERELPEEPLSFHDQEVEDP